jgi:flagellar biosynthesis protein FlhF
MELKRVLGPDNRSATEKALELYGKDALIISNERVNGKIELIVAVDLDQASDPSMNPFETTRRPVALTLAPAPEPAPNAGGERFSAVLQGRLRALRQGTDAPAATRMAAEFDADRQELEKAKDLVEMLRGEFAAMRRELRISQQLGALQSDAGMDESVRPLAAALVDAGVPVGLRSLLIDEIKAADGLPRALSLVEGLLTRSVRREKHGGRLDGVNVIAGPSGAGKTTMLGRLAQAHACEGTFPPDQVAIISFSDRRPGAWNQIQLLGAQAGVDCYRAADGAMLGEILEELARRKLVLIDTAGVGTTDHLEMISAAAPHARFHLLLPADASAATIRRYRDQPVGWSSLMLSKLDESVQPWPMIQLLSDVRLPISFASQHAASAAPLADPDAQLLVKLALANLLLPDAPAASPRDRARFSPLLQQAGDKELQ